MWWTHWRGGADLARLRVVLLINEESCEAVAQVVETETLTASAQPPLRWQLDEGDLLQECWPFEVDAL